MGGTAKVGMEIEEDMGGTEEMEMETSWNARHWGSGGGSRR